VTGLVDNSPRFNLDADCNILNQEQCIRFRILSERVWLSALTIKRRAFV